MHKTNIIEIESNVNVFDTYRKDHIYLTQIGSTIPRRIEISTNIDNKIIYLLS